MRTRDRKGNHPLIPQCHSLSVSVSVCISLSLFPPYIALGDSWQQRDEVHRKLFQGRGKCGDLRKAHQRPNVYLIPWEG